MTQVYVDKSGLTITLLDETYIELSYRDSEITAKITVALEDLTAGINQLLDHRIKEMKIN